LEGVPLPIFVKIVLSSQTAASSRLILERVETYRSIRFGRPQLGDGMSLEWHRRAGVKKSRA
jgi:hypothetical protein